MMRVVPNSHDDNPLKQYFERNPGLQIHKWHHYFDIYHNHFQRYRGRPARVLEIGVFKGGSLQMWREYFGPRAEIFGVDIQPRCKELEGDQIEIFIGSQADTAFLRQLKKHLGSVDILIDDGGHTMEQQTATFEVLYDLVSPDGIYLVEDCHTSYWAHYNGGLRRSGTFIDRTKGWIDSLNAYHSQAPDFAPDDLTRTATGIHFYDSVVVVEKCPNPTKPLASKTGTDPFA